jgi:hypothetical protein
LSITRYGFRDVISGFFEFPTDNARRILPRGVEPLEPHHGTSILAVTVFDFSESEVGEYGEVVYAVIVPPLVRDGRLPKSAFFPWQVATTTQAARAHAIERWHLPHWMEDLELAFRQKGGTIGCAVTLKGASLADLTISEHSWNPVVHTYQSHMKDGDRAYQACIIMEGSQSEHEEETGKLVLHDHPFNAALDLREVAENPFRELWMKDGVQTFHPLVQVPVA